MRERGRRREAENEGGRLWPRAPREGGSLWPRARRLVSGCPRSQNVKGAHSSLCPRDVCVWCDRFIVWLAEGTRARLVLRSRRR